MYFELDRQQSRCKEPETVFRPHWPPPMWRGNEDDDVANVKFTYMVTCLFEQSATWKFSKKKEDTSFALL